MLDLHDRDLYEQVRQEEEARILDYAPVYKYVHTEHDPEQGTDKRTEITVESSLSLEPTGQTVGDRTRNHKDIQYKARIHIQSSQKTRKDTQKTRYRDRSEPASDTTTNTEQEDDHLLELDSNLPSVIDQFRGFAQSASSKGNNNNRIN